MYPHYARNNIAIVWDDEVIGERWDRVRPHVEEKARTSASTILWQLRAMLEAMDAEEG